MTVTQLRQRRPEDRSVRRLNRKRKEMKCLGCGKTMVTDRCHRFCRICARRNQRNRWYRRPRGKIVD